MISMLAPAKIEVISIASGLTTSCGRQAGIHRLRILLTLGVDSTCRRLSGDLLQDSFIQGGVHAEAVHLQGSAGGGAEAKGIDAHLRGPQPPGQLRADQSIGCSPHPKAGRSPKRDTVLRAAGPAARPPAAVAGSCILGGVAPASAVGLASAWIEPGIHGDRVERDQDALPQRGAAGRLQPVDGSQQVLGIVGGRLHGEAAAAERDDADLHRCRLAEDELTRSRLGSFQAGRLGIVAPMLAETSNTRITVPSTRGRLIFACGRARATSRITRPSRNKSGGQVAAEAGSRLSGWLASRPDR